MAFRSNEKLDTGGQCKEMANAKGTGKRGMPTAMACKSKKQVCPAMSNPDGKPNRGGPAR